jgi:hypothetical protein
MKLSLRNLLRNLVGPGTGRAHARPTPTARRQGEQRDERLVPTAPLQNMIAGLGPWPTGGGLTIFTETFTKTGATFQGGFADDATGIWVPVSGKLSLPVAGRDNITLQGGGTGWSNQENALVTEIVNFSGRVKEGSVWTSPIPVNGTLTRIDFFLHLASNPPWTSAQSTSNQVFGWFEPVPE